MPSANVRTSRHQPGQSRNKGTSKQNMGCRQGHMQVSNLAQFPKIDACSAARLLTRRSGNPAMKRVAPGPGSGYSWTIVSEELYGSVQPSFLSPWLTKMKTRQLREGKQIHDKEGVEHDDNETLAAMVPTTWTSIHESRSRRGFDTAGKVAHLAHHDDLRGRMCGPTCLLTLLHPHDACTTSDTHGRYEYTHSINCRPIRTRAAST
ncbi:hypothetical protein BDV95DRAFT_575428 [Massariosphaeria phaeospora]|uniref:Uncharacterized protein n=1 Tax=Massariosphaeria phaeospora TaxID=100035 RepID=A0A7C8M815_9PLEO|nr:hypothetical protein BDV95DRAFT_575428 [Massariosphaeria phaeospora]